MRLIYVLLSPTFGMHQYTADLANRAAAGAFTGGAPADIHLVTTTNLPRDRYSPAVQVHTPITTHGTGFSAEGLRLDALWRAGRLLLRLRPDAVHFTGVHTWNILLVWRLRLAGIPTIHTLHDLQPHSGVRHARLICLWNWLITRSADRILVHGRCHLQELCAGGVPPERSAYVPLLHGFCGHPATAPAPAPSPTASAATPTALFFGRIETYKGVDTLLQAWAQMQRDGAGPRLIVAGQVTPGVYLPALPPAVELRNRRIGDTEAASLFQDSHLLVLPYRDATQSALVAAAYSFGLPVIVSDAGALPEYVLPGETGWVVPAGDVRVLAQTLSLALSDPERLRRMGQAGYEWYLQQRQTETATLSELYAGVSKRRLS
jgi:glycosyltransferase involved in cell wall biosynthesis